MSLVRNARDGVWHARIIVDGRQHWRAVWKLLGWPRSRSRDKPGRLDALRAERELARVVGALIFDRPQPVRVQGRVGDALRQYLSTMRATRSLGHASRTQDVLQRVAAALGDSFEGWMRDRLQAYLDGRRDIGARTIQMYGQSVGQFCRWAVARGLASADPTRGLVRPRAIQREPDFWRIEEIPLLLEACRRSDVRRGDSPWLEQAVRLALGTGARVGELRALTWDAVDLARGAVRLLGKSKRERSVPLARIALDVLALVPVEWRTGPVIVAPAFRNGTHALDVALRAAQLPVRRWHALRHTYASHLVMAGADLRSVQVLLGHASITMTMRYAHLTPDHLAQIARRLPY